MKEKIVIIGASGHARVIIDIVEQEGKYELVGLLDRDRLKGEEVLGYQILGKEADLPQIKEEYGITGALIAIGDNFVRSRVAERLKGLVPELKFVKAIHPSASLAKGVTIGEGSVVMAGVCINSSSSVGRFCILNTRSSLDHDSVVGDFGSLAPGVTTGGNCQIGDFAAIGIGATLIHGVKVGEHAVVGAASLVMKDIPSFSVAYGVPATFIRTRKAGDKYL